MDLFVAAATQAGPKLTPDSFLNAMEATTFPRSIFGGPEFKITKSNRLGTGQSRVSQLQGGRWVAVTDLMAARH